MLDAHVAQKVFDTDHRAAKPYWILATPGAFDKRLMVVAVLGHPEPVGVWSCTLLSQGRLDESSMEPYFREFGKRDLGLVAINPDLFAPDIEGDTLSTGQSLFTDSSRQEVRTDRVLNGWTNRD